MSKIKSKDAKKKLHNKYFSLIVPTHKNWAKFKIMFFDWSAIQKLWSLAMAKKPLVETLLWNYTTVPTRMQEAKGGNHVSSGNFESN